MCFYYHLTEFSVYTIDLIYYKKIIRSGTQYIFLLEFKINYGNLYRLPTTGNNCEAPSL